MKKNTPESILENNDSNEIKKSRRQRSMEESMAKLRARDKKLSAVRIALRIALAATTIFYVFVNVMVALGLITSAKDGENWPLYFADYGYILIAGAGLLAVGTVLCFLKFSRISIIFSAAGTVTVIVIMNYIMSYADDSGFYSTIREMPASAVYQQAMLPTVIVTVLLIALSLMQYFSMEQVQKRRRRKQEESSDAPRII